ncbi:DUF2827 domain-containing protein (plasmid) [Burkholderia ambifaria]|uniref:DUF2827 domain-containing protein n=1 Tax=Burkholderia ambifaria TaxID=152480 RepID=UPI001E5CB8BD|nr:DUF2827 domain-containing protein [Burkholderia ambifaria]UEP39827.1 DUF2827 domain-containing protein [Burkholderia ambifaria]
MNTHDAGSLRIGITIGLRDSAENVWENGITQNALYLAKLFRNSPLDHRVTLINTTGIDLRSPMPWNIGQSPVASLGDAKDSLDVLIELGGQIGPEESDYLRRRRTRIISYCCGPEYVQMMEAMLFSRSMCRSAFINPHYDQVWATPRVMETSAGFFRVLRRQTVREVPLVWDPMCLNERALDLPFAGEYRPRNAPMRVSIMEANIDVVKFCLYPLLIAELAYRSAPRKLGYVHVTNTEHLARANPEFVGVALHLDLVRDGKVSFVGRHDTPQFLSDYTDVVVSHQWGQALNYLYFDVCWNGYPLVHNARMCRDIGYFYRDNDLEDGAAQLENVMLGHNEIWREYLAYQRSAIQRFLATDKRLIEQYDQLLAGLFRRM